MGALGSPKPRVTKKAGVRPTFFLGPVCSEQLVAGNIVAFFLGARDFLPVFRGFGVWLGPLDECRKTMSRQEKYF
jgi:hypothetical protein